MRQPKTRFYQVRVEAPMREWARIWITDDGCISIVSDWGDFGYWFGDPGGEFRRFLTRCGGDYILNKLSCGEKVIDEHATEKAARRLVLDARRSRSIDREQAREEWQAVKAVEWCSEYSRCKWYFEETKLGDSATEIIVYCAPKQAQMFVKVLWPLFVDKLKEELAAEAALAHPGFMD